MSQLRTGFPLASTAATAFAGADGAMMQTPSGKMMAERLAKEAGMSMDQMKASTIPVDLTTWQGGPARIMIMPANDDHEPAAGVAPAATTVNVR